MKLLFRGCILTLLVVQLSIAQKSPMKFGVIPPEDLKMTVYDKDSSASAVILGDYGEAAMAFYATTVKLNFERHVRIKILNKEGLRWADAQIALYHRGSGEERVMNFKGSTYNLENGKLVESEVSKDGMFKEKFNKNINLLKFTFPNVKEGSVLEYSYTISSEFIFNFPDWQFQKDIPTRHSEFWAFIPEFCIYEKYMQGYLTPQYEVKQKTGTDFNSTAHHWIMKDVPAFKEEPLMTSEDDYKSKINFAISHLKYASGRVEEIMGSWEKLCRDLNDSEDFGKVITGSAFLKDKVDEVTAGITGDKEKATAIYNYLAGTVEWDGTEDKYADNVRKVLENKKGTAADINLMLASMLKKAGLDVDMVLLSTRDHGFIRQSFPMEKQFNYVICRAKIGDSFVLIDATDRYLPFGVLPSRCLNGQGLIVSKVNRGWISLESKTKAKTVVSADLRLSPEGSLKGKVHYNYYGYDAASTRRVYYREGEQKYFQAVSANKTWEIESSSIKNTTDVLLPVIESHEIVIPSHASVSGSQIYINPFITPILDENPFKNDNREYPVDYGNLIEETRMVKLVIPEGYAPEEVPPNKVLALPENGGRFLYSVNVTGNVLTFTTTLQINKSLFVQTEYPILKEFYNQMLAKQNEQLVLKKLN
jgi:hypothetical protein